MKKIIALLLLAAIALCTFSCSKESEIPDGMKNAAAEGAYFDLFVPTTWTVNNQGGVSEAYYSSNDKSNVSAALFMNIDLSSETLPVTTAAETSATTDTTSEVKTTYIDLFWNKTARKYTEELNGFELCDAPADVLLDGVPAKRYVFNLTFDGVKYKYLQVIAYAHEQFYVFTYTATVDNYDLHTEEVANIVSVFKIK